MTDEERVDKPKTSIQCLHVFLYMYIPDDDPRRKKRDIFKTICTKVLTFVTNLKLRASIYVNYIKNLFEITQWPPHDILWRVPLLFI